MANTRAVPAGDDWLVRRVKALENKVRMNEGARRLQAATIGAGGITVTDDGSIKFVNAAGDLLLTLDGTNGLTATTLGKISNAALASPVTAKTARGDVNSTNFSADWKDIAPANITVPSGFSTAIVTVIGAVGAMRSGSGQDYLAVCAGIYEAATPYGPTISVSCPGVDGVGTYGATSAMVSWTATLTGLSAGDTIHAVLSAAIGDDAGDVSPGWISGSGNGHCVVTAFFFAS